MFNANTLAKMFGNTPPSYMTTADVINEVGNIISDYPESVEKLRSAKEEMESESSPMNTTEDISESFQSEEGKTKLPFPYNPEDAKDISSPFYLLYPKYRDYDVEFHKETPDMVDAEYLDAIESFKSKINEVWRNSLFALNLVGRDKTRLKLPKGFDNISKSDERIKFMKKVERKCNNVCSDKSKREKRALQFGEDVIERACDVKHNTCKLHIPEDIPVGKYERAGDILTKSLKNRIKKETVYDVAIRKAIREFVKNAGEVNDYNIFKYNVKKANEFIKSIYPESVVNNYICRLEYTNDPFISESYNVQLSKKSMAARYGEVINMYNKNGVWEGPSCISITNTLKNGKSDVLKNLQSKVCVKVPDGKIIKAWDNLGCPIVKYNKDKVSELMTLEDSLENAVSDSVKTYLESMIKEIKRKTKPYPIGKNKVFYTKSNKANISIGEIPVFDLAKPSDVDVLSENMKAIAEPTEEFAKTTEKVTTPMRSMGATI